jgi:hypothetical protein
MSFDEQTSFVTTKGAAFPRGEDEPLPIRRGRATAQQGLEAGEHTSIAQRRGEG